MPATKQQVILGLYVAFFNRAPDKEGFNFWNGQATSNSSLPAFKQIALGFAEHPKFSSLYDDLSNQQFVEAIYKNVLGSEGDLAGTDFWVNTVDTGISRSDMVTEFVYTALNLNLSDTQFDGLTVQEKNTAQDRQDTLFNKVKIAQYFIDTFGDATNIEKPNDLEHDIAYLAGIEILRNVNHTLFSCDEAHSAIRLTADGLLVTNTPMDDAVFTFSDLELTTGETSVVTIAFNEIVIGLSLEGIRSPNGTLSDLITTDGGKTYIVLFTPTSGINDNVNRLSIDMTLLRDEAGNVGSGHAESGNYEVNTITVIPLDTTDPVFTSIGPAVAINENSGAGQSIYTAVATDASTVTYSLKPIGDFADFSVNSSTGAVTLTADPDFETKPSYSFTVIATDSSGNTSEQAISLAINDIVDEDAPVFTSSSTAAAINEGSGSSQVIYTVTATDANAPVIYSLKPGDDSADFSIAGGAVTLIDNPDFDTKAIYNFTVIATDPTGNMSENAISLTVNDVIPPIELSDIRLGGDSRGFIINGVAAGDESGISVSGAGDVNGDGLDDLIVGAHLDDNVGGIDSGSSFVVFGKVGGGIVNLSTIEAGADGFIINGVGPDDRSGISVSNAGDVNGDGLADLIVGADKDKPNGNNSGASFVVFGKADSTPINLSDVEAGTGGFIIKGDSNGDHSGISVSNAGDVNGDGLADLIVGADRDDPTASNSGASFVVFGKTGGTAVELSDIKAGMGGFVINGVSLNDRSGFSVSNAGDVNGDGLADLIVGAHLDDPNAATSGASFVVFGKTSGSAINLSDIDSGAGNGFVINGVSLNDHSGRSVSSAGDVNGDGLADLIVGVDRDDTGGSNRGSSLIVFGKTDHVAVELSAVEIGTGGFVIHGAGNTDRSGRSVSSAGDINGDGLADLIVGAHQGDPNALNSGASYVVFGKTITTAVELSDIESGIGGFVINGESADDRSGASVSDAGDVNGDGFDDVIIGAYQDDNNGTESGASFVVFGGQSSAATIGTTGSDTLTGDTNANQLVAGQGDDILIGLGGADVLRGGAGDDVLAISDLSFASLGGGTGSDTLRFDAALNADFRTLANTKLDSIEIIDLLTDGGNSTLSFDILDIINLNESQTRADTLHIHGLAGDVVNLDDTSDGQAGAWANAGGGVYEFTASDVAIGLIATVTIDVAMTVNII